MPASKRVRWECPEGLHPGVLGSTRPPQDSIVRFCLPCSEKTGWLVQRTAPALDRQRLARQVQRELKAQRARERDRAAAATAHMAECLSADGTPIRLDMLVLLRKAWRTEELRSAQREATTGARLLPLPDLVIRRGCPDAGRAASMRRYEPGTIRARDGMSGHARYDGSRIVLTIAPTCGEEWVRAIVVHEAAHAAAPLDVAHGPRWRSAYIRAIRELYGVVVANVGAAWQLDEAIAQTLYDRAVSAS